MKKHKHVEYGITVAYRHIYLHDRFVAFTQKNQQTASLFIKNHCVFPHFTPVQNGYVKRKHVVIKIVYRNTKGTINPIV